MTKKGKDSGRKGEEATVAGVGALFRGLGDFVEVMGGLIEQGEQHAERQGEFRVKGLGDEARGVYGFSIRTGIGGIPQVQRFGNIRPTPKGPVVDDVREPLVDVFDEGAEIMVTAELPGVADEDVVVTAGDATLSLETKGDRRFAKEIALPAAVDRTSLRRSYRNGILQMQIRKI